LYKREILGAIPDLPGGTLIGIPVIAAPVNVRFLGAEMAKPNESPVDSINDEEVRDSFEGDSSFSGGFSRVSPWGLVVCVSVVWWVSAASASEGWK
jgi:hypothetical protein